MDAVTLARVCKRWRDLLWREIFKYITLPYSRSIEMMSVLERLWKMEFGVRNAVLVKNLYISPVSSSRMDYFLTLLICWICSNVEDLTLST